MVPASIMFMIRAGPGEMPEAATRGNGGGWGGGGGGCVCVCGGGGGGGGLEQMGWGGGL